MEGQKELAHLRILTTDLRHEAYHTCAVLMACTEWLRRNPEQLEHVSGLMESSIQKLFQTIRDFEFDVPPSSTNRMRPALTTKGAFLLRVISGIHDRLAGSNSRIEGQRGLDRFRKLISNLRHEANVPCSFLRSCTELLRIKPEQLERVLSQMQSSIEKLLQTISDFQLGVPASSTNRIQKSPSAAPESSGPTGPAATTARPLFAEARDLFRYLPEAQSIEIRCGPTADTQFLGHSQLLRVLAILIQNAAEAIGANGKITLRAQRRKARLKGTRSEAVILEVEDTGPGIPAEVQERLFHPFFSTKSYGIGMGLVTAAEIVGLIGGAIKFKTKLGHGTTFTVILPAYKKS